MTTQRDALDKRLKLLADRRASVVQRLQALDAQIEKARAKQRSLVPPFRIGDEVLNSRGSRVKILAMDKAFGGWVAQVVFLKPGEDLNTAKRYTYMASDLENDE